MMSVGTYEAKTHFAQFVERAARGEEFLITKKGKPMARILPPATEPVMKSAQEAWEDIRELQKEIRTSGKVLKKGESWRDFAHAGHRYY